MNLLISNYLRTISVSVI